MTDIFDQLASVYAEENESILVNQLLRFYETPLGDGGIDGSPYAWQVEFHNAGKEYDQRAIIAANRVGKTRTAAVEVAIHLTGLYPDWWEGHRLDKPNDWIVAGETQEDMRNIQQLALFGKINEERKPDGTGWVPKDRIINCTFRQGSLTNILDTVDVRHVSGGISTVSCKSYEQGESKFQGVMKDGAWLDEEPQKKDVGVFAEIETRLLDKQGILLFTRTPLYGLSKFVKHFIKGGPGIFYITVGWDNAPHLDEKAKAKLYDRYDLHERKTRTKGIPMMGTSAVYPIEPEQILMEPQLIPDYFRRIAGCDFGIDHPAAGAWLAHDENTDTIWLYDCYRMRGETAAYHAQALKARGEWIPVSWPHDGMQRDKGSGESLANQYRDRGANMLEEHATWPSDRNVKLLSRETGNMDILERMRTGRFKVFNTPACMEFVDEIQTLIRKDGQIIAEDDDIESAVRYAMMMLRYAISDTEHSRVRPVSAADSDFDPLAEFSIGRTH